MSVQLKLAPYAGKYNYSSLLKQSFQIKKENDKLENEKIRKELIEKNIKTLSFDEKNIYPLYDVRYCISRKSIPSNKILIKNLNIGYMYTIPKGTDPSPKRKFEEKLFDKTNLSNLNKDIFSDNKWKNMVFNNNNRYDRITPIDILKLFDDEFNNDISELNELDYMIPYEEFNYNNKNKINSVYKKYFNNFKDSEYISDNDSYDNYDSYSDSEYIDDISSIDEYDDNISYFDEDNNDEYDNYY